MNHHPLARLLPALTAPVLFAGCSPVAWERDYQAGMQQVMQQRRRALVQFVTALSSETREMEEVFADPEIQRLVQNYICIRVDAVLDKALADQYGVQAIPSLFVVRQDQTLAGTASGKMDVDQLRVFLIKHSFD